jgi:hypothetical protein
MPAQKHQRVWVFLAGAIVFRVLDSLYWALVGGLGWGFGAAIGRSVAFPAAVTLVGAAGLAFTMLSVLTIRWGQTRSELTPMYLASLGGAAAGSASLSLLSPLSPQVSVVLGGGVGFFVGLITSVMKQYFAPVTALHACTITLAGTALFAGIGFLVGGVVGWTAAGGISLSLVACLAECWRRDPAVEIDAGEQPIRVIPRREMCRHVVRQSWSLTDPLAWGWNGLLGGLLASNWASWVAAHPDVGAVRVPFLACGGLAAVSIIGVRLGILKPTKQSQPTDGSS